jgi:hypothetical protein
MHVCIDEAGQDETAVGIDELCRGACLAHCSSCANVDDKAVLNGNAAALDEGLFFVSRIADFSMVAWILAKPGIQVL